MNQMFTTKEISKTNQPDLKKSTTKIIHKKDKILERFMRKIAY